MFNNFYTVKKPYFFPDEEGETSSSVLGDDEETTEQNEEEKDEDETETSESEGEEGESDDEDEDGEEKKDDKEKEKILARADIRELKKEFPDLFKKFPQLREAVYREQSFTEIFPTIEDAQTAADQVAAYEEISDLVAAGNTDKFLADLKEFNSKGAKKFIANFLPSVQKMDENLYSQILMPVMDQFFKNVYIHARTVENEEDKKNIQAAAKIVRKLLMGGDWNDIEKEFKGGLNTEPSEEDKAEEKRRQQADIEKYSGLYNNVKKHVYGILENEISKGFEDIKSNKGLMKIAVSNVKQKVLDDMDKDTVYLGRIQNYWKREARVGYTGAYKNSITTAFMAKARTLIAKYRSEIRKDLGIKKVAESGEEKREVPRISGGSRSAGGIKQMTPQVAKEKKLSTRQIFD